jgi:hypothetical protein
MPFVVSLLFGLHYGSLKTELLQSPLLVSGEEVYIWQYLLSLITKHKAWSALTTTN